MINRILLIIFFTAFNIASACSIFIKNDASGKYVFTKNRDVTYASDKYNDDTYKNEHQEIVTFHNPSSNNTEQGKYKYVELSYGETGFGNPTDIFSTGTNEYGLSLSYNYDTQQLGDEGGDLASKISSVAKQESDLARYIVANAKTIEEANGYIIEAVQKQNQAKNVAVPIAVPMFLGIAEYRPNGLLDKSEIIEIIVTNAKEVEDTYNDIISKQGSGAETIAKEKALEVMKLAYSFTYPTNGYSLETNSIKSPNLVNTYSLGNEPTESKSRYEALTTLLSHSANINSQSNDYYSSMSGDIGGYSTEIAHMFAKDYFVPTNSDPAQNGYVDAESLAVSRSHTKATYIVSRVNSAADNSLDKSLSLFVELTNEFQIYNRATFQLDNNFWNSHTDNQVLLSNKKPFLADTVENAKQLKGVY